VKLIGRESEPPARPAFLCTRKTLCAIKIPTPSMTFEELIKDLSSINFGDGEIRSLGDFLSSEKIKLNMDELYTEDLIQITYRINDEVYFVDVGSYNNSSLDKSIFKTLLVKNKDWEHPLLEIRFKNLKLMKGSLEYTISCLDRLREV